MDTIAGLGFVPTEYVDVSDVIDTKAAMLEAHETQLVWLRDHDGVDIVEEMKTAARYRGQQCGVALRGGVRPVPHVAARHDDEAASVDDRGGGDR